MIEFGALVEEKAGVRDGKTREDNADKLWVFYVIADEFIDKGNGNHCKSFQEHEGVDYRLLILGRSDFQNIVEAYDVLTRESHS